MPRARHLRTGDSRPVLCRRVGGGLCTSWLAAGGRVRSDCRPRSRTLSGLRSMADLTPEQLSALLDEKLRPINAKLDEHSRKLDHYAQRWGAVPAEPREFPGKLLVLLLLVIAAAVGLVF